MRKLPVIGEQKAKSEQMKLTAKALEKEEKKGEE